MASADQLLARRVLGWGAAAPLITPRDIGRDLVLARRPGTRALDLACVVGADNLGQDLAMALTTPRGADPLNTDYGFDGLLALVEETEPVMIRERLRASVAQAISRDARVRAVTAIEVGEPSGGVSRVLQLDVTVDTIAGGTAGLLTSLGI